MCNYMCIIRFVNSQKDRIKSAPLINQHLRIARLKSHVLLVVGYAVWGASDVYAEEVTELEPVIVYGSYDVDTPFAVTGHAPQWSVQSVDMITASDTEAIAADRIEDFADTLPGVLLGRTQAGIASNVWLRGFSLQGRLHLDGVSDNRRYMLRDPATMERVEVSRGLILQPPVSQYIKINKQISDANYLQMVRNLYLKIAKVFYSQYSMLQLLHRLSCE